MDYPTVYMDYETAKKHYENAKREIISKYEDDMLSLRQRAADKKYKGLDNIVAEMKMVRRKLYSRCHNLKLLKPRYEDYNVY